MRTHPDIADVFQVISTFNIATSLYSPRKSILCIGAPIAASLDLKYEKYVSEKSAVKVKIRNY